MEKLPTELLERIFSHLRGLDRLNAALVCQRWNEIVSRSRSLCDICLVLRAADLEKANPCLVHSYRQYTNLKICDGTLSEFNSEFWKRIARELVSLKLEEIDLSAEVFYAILGECHKLQSLELTGWCSSMMSDGLLRPPENICVAESLRNVRHLSLRKNRKLSDASFNQMLLLMPNITSLCLAGCSHLLFHPREPRRFHTDTIESSSAVLTFQNVLVCMMRSEQKFVDLDLSGTLINDEALIQIVELYRESLTSLRLESCDQLTAKAYEAIGECSKLRLLSLHRTRQTNDDNLECILAKTPELEHLDLRLCRLISSRSLLLIAQLKKLRHLNLSGCWGIRIDTLGSLSALTDLQHLDLGDTDVNVEAFRQLASLRDLRNLELRRCADLAPECVVIICNNFKRLEKLDLFFSITLTDGEVCKFYQLKYLRSLDITGARGISDRSLENGIGASDMKSLSLGWCSMLTDTALASIAKHHVCLEYLDLQYCDRITDVGLILAVQRLPRLRTLILYSCRSLTDRSLHALRDYCPHLRRLNVEYCSMSGDEMNAFAHLRHNFDIK